MGNHTEGRIGWCIFTNTLFAGKIPVYQNEDENPVVFESELEAQRVIAEELRDHLQEFLSSGREFDDAIASDDFVEQVSVLADGSVVDKDGRHFMKGNW